MRKALQSELIQRDRMAAAGRLVTELAHEIRNPVASVRNCLEVIHERVAESGNNQPLTTMLQGNAGVAAVGAAPGPNGPILPGEQGTVELSATIDMRLSMVSMLVCTNDGFTAVSGEALPQEVGGTVTVQIDAYDAGTEQNTEASTDLVPPCVMATTGSTGGTGADQPEIAEDQTIRAHPGIDGDTDGDDILDAQHQWTDPVAEIRIERIG